MAVGMYASQGRRCLRRAMGQWLRFRHVSILAMSGTSWSCYLQWRLRMMIVSYTDRVLAFRRCPDSLPPSWCVSRKSRSTDLHCLPLAHRLQIQNLPVPWHQTQTLQKWGQIRLERFDLSGMYQRGGGCCELNNSMEHSKRNEH